MKIGIITFHWATNYGAILQALALQSVLQKLGHTVEIINYKPKQYDTSLWHFIRYRHFLHPISYFESIKKEQKMVGFRKLYLNCSKRYYSIIELKESCRDYDVLISGSDQVMNPFFLVNGESEGSTAYFLDFGREDATRISYAASFGTTKYPEKLISQASPLIKNFKVLSVREDTGVEIMKTMGRPDAIVTPDPTILLKAQDYDSLLGIRQINRSEILVYMLHNRLNYIQNRLPYNISAITSEPIKEWIAAIKNSCHVITNSFHGMVFSILYHTPFTVVLQSTRNEGMNDRFFTLLEKLDLKDRITDETSFNGIIEDPINWTVVDAKMQDFREYGFEFLKINI